MRTWLESQKEAVRKVVWVSNEGVRYSEFLDRYVNDVAFHSLRPRTMESYTYMVKNRIKPAFGDMRISTIRPGHLSHLYSELLNEGLSKYSVKYIHAIISKSLTVARTGGLVVRNVAEDVHPPTPQPREINLLTVDEVKRFLKVLENDRMYAFYVVICTMAVRKGEALGIQKKNLLLNEEILQIRHSLSQFHGKGLILGEPKSKASKRDLALPQFTINALREHLVKYPNTSTYVFATGNNTPFSPYNIMRHFKHKLVESGLPVETRMHDLRHSVISWLLASGGISINDAQGFAGHSQPSTTLNIYGHFLPGYNKNAAKKIEGYFSTE